MSSANPDSAALTRGSAGRYCAVHFLLLKVASSVGMGLVLKQADTRGMNRPGFSLQIWSFIP